MKKTICIVLAFILVLLLPVGVLAVLDAAIPAQYDQSFLAGLALKYDLIKNESSPKLVIIGGSSAAFGLDTELLEEHLPYEVVNFGLYATLGTKVMMDLASDYIEEGDVVIVAPELDPQTFSLYFNAQSVWQAAESDKSILSGVASDNMGDMLGGYWKYIAGKFSSYQKNTPDPTGVYSLSAIDANGEIDYERTENIMALGYDPNMMINLNDSLMDSAFIDYVNDFTAACEKKGAVCYFSFSPTNKAALSETNTESTILAFYDKLAKQLDCEVISNINDCLYDQAYFYDTNFHLNDTGVIAHSITLIRDLKRVLGDNAVNTLEVPEPPQPGTSAVVGEDATVSEEREDMSALFTYGEFANGRMITGVTDEGKAKEILYTPAAYDGVAVLAIAEGAFDGCQAAEIYLNPSIIQLYDG
ncbi:MAG: hypothetical protein IJ037_01460, partial [Clostridia bacterium]|nr:hypothetical protein [Clostridia bacterium]